MIIIITIKFIKKKQNKTKQNKKQKTHNYQVITRTQNEHSQVKAIASC